jgi:hypothetical protein
MAYKFNVFTGNFDMVNTSSAIPSIPVSGILTGGLVYTIPTGYMLANIIVKESGGTPISIRFGTSAGTDDIAFDQTMNASLYNSITLNKEPVAGGYNLYITKTGGGAFTPSVLTFYLLLTKVY